jgi:hypothetical protein
MTEKPFEPTPVAALLVDLTLDTERAMSRS